MACSVELKTRLCAQTALQMEEKETSPQRFLTPKGGTVKKNCNCDGWVQL